MYLVGLVFGYYFHVEKDKFFCHGGFNHKKPIMNQKKINFAFNRMLFKISKVYAKRKIKFKIKYDRGGSIEINEIFIGHSPTKNNKPNINSNLINIDTGCGSTGCLTLMDITTKKFVQSAKTEKLYQKKTKDK